MNISIAETSFQQSSLKTEGGIGAALLFLWSSMVLFLWGFAFIPAPEKSPEWVMQTQAVCFGTLSNGLPAAHGWMLLILSPLAILSVMWASHTKEFSAAKTFIRHSKGAKIFIAVLLGIAMWDAHWVGKRLTYAYRLSRLGVLAGVKNPLPLDFLRLNKLTPAFQLINQNGDLINQEIFRGKVTILTFAFAHCSTICPMLIKDAVEAQKRVDSRDLQTIVITIDPWRDTPNSLPSLAKTWSLLPGSYLLSGSPERVMETLDKFQISSKRNLQSGEVTHAAQMMIVDRKGRIAYSFLNPSVDWIITASGRILNE